MSSIDKINVGGVDFEIASSPTPVMAPVETGTTATQAYAVGDYVIVGSTLHEVTAAIAIDDTFTEGINISTSTSLGDEINQLNNDLTVINRKVGNGVRIIGITSGHGSDNNGHTVNLSDFNYYPSSADDYIVLLEVKGANNTSLFPTITSKTTTSFHVKDFQTGVGAGDWNATILALK